MILEAAAFIWLAQGAYPYVGMPSDYFSAGTQIEANEYVWGLGRTSYVRLYETPDERSSAVVEFRNEPIHSNERVTRTLEIEGMVVEFTVDVGHGNRPDILEVTPPDGFIAVPPRIDVPESDTGFIRIYPENLLAF